ncbi:organic cation transporter protein-like isoform X4 [Palaemon carinicauda]|uniref:organic cation transporter protein-like isoform X4 n=1 Tax=Palaemon carinicauda TaxID=392227 RepID=UPI0035B5BEE2
MKDSSGDGVQQQDPILFPTGLHELNAKMVSNKFEDLLSTLGTGKWSFLYFICDMYAELLLPAHAMNGVFLAPEVKYTCVPPDQPSVAGVSEDSCMYYVNTTTAEGNTTSQSFACTDWVFDNTTYEWTLTSEFELVCGRAYLRATYQGIQMIATILTCSFLGYFCDSFVDESPRWLILKGREDEAIAVLRKAARWNGAHLPTDERLREIFREIQLEQKVTMKKEKKEKKQLSDYIPTLLRTPKVRSITILLSSVLFTSSIVYAGLTLSGDNYSTDPFLYIVLCGVMEIPGYTVAAPLINWLGKKKPMFFFLNFCGVAVLALAFIPEDINWLIMSLAMLGKLCNSMAFMILFVYLNELFPTEVRMQGIGVGVTMTCVGGAVAPYITDYLGPILPWVPSVIFGISSIVASFLLVPLPETKGRPMLETVEALEGRGPTKDGHEPVKQDRDSTTPNDEQKQFVEA